MEDRIAILVDEIREAEKVLVNEYAQGYLNGLHMALSILEGLTD